MNTDVHKEEIKQFDGWKKKEKKRKENKDKNKETQKGTNERMKDKKKIVNKERNKQKPLDRIEGLKSADNEPAHKKT